MRHALIGFFFLLATLNASAQVINTEKKRLNQSEEGWAGNIDTGLSLIRNTREIFQLTNKVHVQYRKRRHTLLLLNDFSLMSVNRDRLLNKGFQHIRYNFEKRPYLIPEAFVQAQYNQIWKIDVRILAGGGPRFRLHHTDSSYLYMGTLVMYEYEEVNQGAEYNRDVRFSGYVSGGYQFKPWVGVEHITYFQPRVDDLSDFRLSSETALRFALTSRLAFHTTFKLSYDSRPPDDLQTTFYSWINGLSFGF